ncbi:exodeoxyribonuclease V subunit alpha [Borrelia miyamotoi]|uniref:RecBCD enzyme subunit RecD n=1 Tax=Borrelia miyamotoi TaxID=47466 RepID=A0AAQ2WW15_9SPIR|nr:exodeoxyribonuclease V subunit alpha [Borrelia miyamotoi]AGT27574.1 exodeoxyribonuclease V subunit alpha [Borrelia miyamotoi LB-2001]AJA58747.1 exodeoxyribonuclease V subunit alpha [Borrelia miyamotoi]AOW95829.1 exodeoxyribonuclease V subunit alpha [Borrelia miyamotoi]QTL83720.1 exodeoxyribonuclease V subunit alpha [Borrelia miyamotoi]WAZ84976.1 exodeoxyribonuclease V subunit alpha [Borrelia miyamotoi]
MRNYLVLREFLKNNNRNHLAPELKIYEIIEALNINIGNCYKAYSITKKIQNKKCEELTIFLIFLFNYLSKGHLRANINLLIKDIQKTIECAFLELEEKNQFYQKSINILEEIAKFTKPTKINEILLHLKENNVIKDYNKDEKITTPLILENDIHIYTQKNFREEEELIQKIDQRLKNNKSKISDQRIKNIITNLNTKGLSEEQINSIKKSLKSNFFILSGGPGTGKTTTINYILKAIDIHLNVKQKVALIAPTGKASQKLKSSLKESFKKIETEYGTIQKLLKTSFISKGNKYDESNFLEFEIIIIDEASMIDASTFLKLLKAIKISTKLIITGDKNQLPSIAGGNVYSSLMKIKEISAENVEILKKNFRSNNEINLLAEAIYKEDANLIALQLNVNKNIILKDIKKVNIENELLNYRKNLYKDISNFDLNSLKDKEVESIINILLNTIILCSKNFGRFGIKRINEIIKLDLKKIYGNLIGQIILITQNDYKNNLFNGERGILFKEDSKIYALFKREDEKYKKINLNLLNKYELSFATTIHKSQGSEYKHVQIIIEDHPFLTKELLYTAITRAKESIEIISNKDIIKNVSLKRIERDSKILEHINALNQIDK